MVSKKNLLVLITLGGMAPVFHCWPSWRTGANRGQVLYWTSHWAFAQLQHNFRFPTQGSSDQRRATVRLLSYVTCHVEGNRLLACCRLAAAELFLRTFAPHAAHCTAVCTLRAHDHSSSPPGPWARGQERASELLTSARQRASSTPPAKSRQMGRVSCRCDRRCAWLRANGHRRTQINPENCGEKTRVAHPARPSML